MGGAMDPRVKQSFEFPGYVSKPQHTYTPYHTKALNALRKATPNISKSFLDKHDVFFESASITQTIDLISEGPIEGFSDKAGNTIRFYNDNRFMNTNFFKSVYCRDERKRWKF